MVGQQLGRPHQQAELAEAVLHEGVVGGVRPRAGGEPGPRILAQVAARRLQRTFGDAEVEVGHDQLRHLRAQRGLRGVGAGRAPAAPASSGSSTPSKCTLPLSVWRWPKASQSACTSMPGWRVGSTAIRAALASGSQAEIVSQSEPTEPEAKLLIAVQQVAAGGGRGDQALVERVQGIAPEDGALDAGAQQAALLVGVAVQLDAGQLQVVEAEQVGEGAVGAGDDADRRSTVAQSAPRPPNGVRRHRQRQQAGGADQFALGAGMAAGAYGRPF
jgi:hypothetical protein